MPPLFINFYTKGPLIGALYSCTLLHVRVPPESMCPHLLTTSYVFDMKERKVEKTGITETKRILTEYLR